MKKIEKVLAYLGEPYSLTIIDGEEVIYRNLGNGIDFEISGVRAGKETYSVYVWQLIPHKEIIGVYHRIHGSQELKDVLGYLAFKYQNLQEIIRIEREELPQ